MPPKPATCRATLANRLIRAHRELETLTTTLKAQVTEQTCQLRERAEQLEQKNRPLEEAHEGLREASLTDPLTGLSNRGFLTEYLPHEEQKLTASDGSARNQLGYSVSVSSGTALVGARGDDDSGAGSGSAYLFSYNGSTWVEGAKLTASDGTALDTFGRSVSISDGTALVGAHGNDDDGSNSGSAYVFGEPVPISQVPALGPLGIAILLGLLGATAYWRLRDSVSAA